MDNRPLGNSGTSVSVVSFGAGPISGLMVGDNRDNQRTAIQRALDGGINWFDTAATYGEGRSEQSLGATLAASRASRDVHIATKVRLLPEQLGDLDRAVRESFEASLGRLGADRVTLLQLHNSVTSARGDLPTSLTVKDVLGPGGVVSAFQSLQDEGTVDALGFTALGDSHSLNEVMRSGVFSAAQIPFNLLTPFEGHDGSSASVDVDYCRLIEECHSLGIGVIAIRVFAGGALVGQPPSPHTHRTKFFTLDLYRSNQRRAVKLARVLPNGLTLAEASLRFVLSVRGVTTALIGFASAQQVDQAIRFVQSGPLDGDVVDALRNAGSEPYC